MLCSSVALEKEPSKALNMQPCLGDQTAELGVLSFPFITFCSLLLVCEVLGPGVVPVGLVCG